MERVREVAAVVAGTGLEAAVEEEMAEKEVGTESEAVTQGPQRHSPRELRAVTKRCRASYYLIRYSFRAGIFAFWHLGDRCDGERCLTYRERRC